VEGSSETILGLARVSIASSEAPAALIECMSGQTANPVDRSYPMYHLRLALNRPPLLTATDSFSVLGPSDIGDSGRRSDMGESFFLLTFPVGSCRLCSCPLFALCSLGIRPPPSAVQQWDNAQDVGDGGWGMAVSSPPRVPRIGIYRFPCIRLAKKRNWSAGAGKSSGANAKRGKSESSNQTAALVEGYVNLRDHSDPPRTRLYATPRWIGNVSTSRRKRRSELGGVEHPLGD
jgi:hypothetical protein